jgi:carboxyl-terminal processing protease
LDEEIQMLEVRRSERAVNDPDFNYLLNDIAALGAIRDRDTVSLNLAAREVERESLQQEQLTRENERRAALGLEPVASIEELESTEPPDVLLEQATDVVADMAAIEAPAVADIAAVIR